MDAKEKFTQIYKNNEWADGESRSGGGSTVKRTADLRKWLLQMIEKYDIRSMLDCPCGDFNWMKEMVLPRNFIYIGADMVDEMVKNNQIKYGRSLRNFLIRDLTIDPLPRMDLILCKDLFLHLSFEDIWKVIINFKDSGARYFIVSNSYACKKNGDQKTGGTYRNINLQKEPFNFPNYLEVTDTKDTPMTLFKMDVIPVI